jgi:hypothetical protein
MESACPELWQRSVFSRDRIGCGKADTAHTLEDFRSCGGTADVPVFVGWIRTYDQEIVGGGDTAVSCAGGEDGYIAGVYGDGGSLLAAKHDFGCSCCETENLVGG